MLKKEKEKRRKKAAGVLQGVPAAVRLLRLGDWCFNRKLCEIAFYLKKGGNPGLLSEMFRLC